jgi:NitT/TauT family transport system substrate-binding protein
VKLTWRKALAALTALAVVAVVAGCGSSDPKNEAAAKAAGGGTGAVAADAAPLDQVVKLNVGTSPTLNAAPLFVAQAKGYFADEHLDVTIVPGITGVVAQPQLATGRMDAAYVGASVAFFNGVAGGQDVKFAVGAGQTKLGCTPTCAGSGFVVLRDGPIKDVADLKGKKIACNAGAAGTSGFYLSQLLKQADLTLDDVELVDLLLPDGLAALNNGAVAAAIDSGAGMTQHIAPSGPYDLVGDMDKVLANGNGGGFIFGSRLIKSNRQAGVAFIRALLKAVRVDLQGDWLADPAIIDILAKATGSPTAVIKASPVPVFDHDLAQTTKVLADMQAFWRSQGQLLTYPKDMAPAQYSDADLLPAALGK